MTLSLQRKLVVFLLLILSAPLYLLLRFFYGWAFLRLVAAGLAIQLVAVPFLKGFFDGHPVVVAYGDLYDGDLGWALFALASYVAPIHLVWILFGWFARDGRHDVDDPGRPLIPFVHPWLIDIPAAIGLPLAVTSLAASGTRIPLLVPEMLGYPLGDIGVSASWIPSAALVAGAYIGVAVLTVEPPRLGLRRWLKLRNRPRKLAHDVVRIALPPRRGRAARAEVLAQRPEGLRRLAGGG